MFTSVLSTPLGQLVIEANEELVFKILFRDHAVEERENGLSLQAKTELQEYFEGVRSEFTFPFGQEGSEFSQKVWSALTEIGPGKPISYLSLSKKLQNPLAIRAIASANGRNNLTIVVPCHRVIGSDGSLVGYSGGLWRKKWLLDHEAGMMKMGQSTLVF